MTAAFIASLSEFISPMTFPETAWLYRCHSVWGPDGGLGEVCFVRFGGEPAITTPKCRDLLRNIRFAKKRAGTVGSRRTFTSSACREEGGLRGAKNNLDGSQTDRQVCPPGASSCCPSGALPLGLLEQSQSHEVLALSVSPSSSPGYMNTGHVTDFWSPCCPPATVVRSSYSAPLTPHNGPGGGSDHCQLHLTEANWTAGAGE